MLPELAKALNFPYVHYLCLGKQTDVIWLRTCSNQCEIFFTNIYSLQEMCIVKYLFADLQAYLSWKVFTGYFHLTSDI